MRFGTFIVAMILMAGVFTGVMTFLVDLSTEYGVTADTDGLNNTFEKTNDLINTTQDIQNEFTEGDFDAESAVTVAAKAVFTAPKLAFQSIGIFISMVTDAMSLTTIPAWVFTTFLAVVTILLVMALAFWYQGRDM